MIESAVENATSIQLDTGTLLEAYRTMRTIREFEERLHVEFATGEIPGFVHLYAGEEPLPREYACARAKATGFRHSPRAWPQASI